MEEKMAGLIIIGIIFVIFLILALILLAGKGASLIAGYNTMPKEEKKKYDEERLTKFMGKVMLGVCFALLVLAFGIFFDSQLLNILSTVLVIALVIFAVIYVNTKGRFKSVE